MGQLPTNCVISHGGPASRGTAGKMLVARDETKAPSMPGRLGSHRMEGIYLLIRLSLAGEWRDYSESSRS